MQADVLKGAIQAFERYNAAPSAQRLFDAFNTPAATEALWTNGPLRRFDEAAAAGDVEVALEVARGTLGRAMKTPARGALRVWMASRAILVHRSLALGEAVMRAAREPAEPAHRTLTDLLLLQLRCRVQRAPYAPLLDALFAAGAPILPHACVQWLRHRWRYEAPSRRLLADAITLARRLGPRGHSVWTECIAIALRIGDDCAADAIVAERKLAGAAARILPLAARRRDAQSGPCARLHDHLVSQSARLSEELADTRTNLAIVGNSPCERALGRGARIDSRDQVIRFNRFETTDAFAADYGRRCTHHARGPGDDEALHARSRAAGRAILIQCDILYAPRDWTPFLQLHNEGVQLAALPAGSHRALQRELGAEPSLGLALLAHAKRVRPSLGPDDCFGFSFIDQIGAKAASAHYFEDARPALTHNWEKERVIFDRLMRAPAPAAQRRRRARDSASSAVAKSASIQRAEGSASS